MTQEHPITPPPELVEKWVAMLEYCEDIDVFTDVVRWGADMELEACCEEMKSIPSPLGIPFGEMASNALRDARRPKPPSLKEQALKELQILCYTNNVSLAHLDTIRRALEQLND